MAGASITMDARELKERLRAAAKSCRSIQPALRDAGELIIRSTNKTFESGGRPSRWAPLSAKTLARVGLLGTAKRHGKRSRFNKSGALRVRAQRNVAGKKILIDTGRLLRSISYRVSSHDVVIGTNVAYAATHQFGRGRIPARPFLLVQAEDVPVLRQIMVRHLLGAFR